MVQQWVELGLVGEFATMAVAASAYFVRSYLAPVWPAAVEAGLVTGKPRDALTAALDVLFVGLPAEPEDTGRAAPATEPGPVRRADVNRIFRYVRTVVRNSLVDLQAGYDARFLAAAEGVLRQAALGKWGRDRFVGAMGDLAREYGAEGFRGSHAETWYKTVVLNASYNQGLLLAFNGSPTRSLYPFLAYRTVGDERVRPNHAALDGMVAPTTWPGWRQYLPPLGWNCRCRAVPVSYQVARELGWTGQAFPRGEGFFTPFVEGGELFVPGFDSGFSSPLQLTGGLLPF